MSDAWLNDVFISYSRADAAWAQRLAASLKKADPARRIFFDLQSLRAGDDWDQKIDTALASSQHLIVVWSDVAQASDWVNRELYQFLAAAKPLKNPRQRLLCLNLQGANRALKSFQHVSHAGIQTAYASAAQTPQADWDVAMQAVEDGLAPHRRLLDVPLAILTLSQANLVDTTPATRAMLLQEFGLDDAGLAFRYGARRDQWRPFDAKRSIAELMETLRADVTHRLPGLALQWRGPADSFWEDIDAAQEFVNQDFLPAELSVLVIDPVAMYRHELYQRLMLFQDCLASSRTTIVTLPPFGAPANVLSLRDALIKRTKPYFDNYFRPSVPPLRPMAAHCGWNVGDADEVRRLLLAAASGLVQTPAPVLGAAFLAQQERRP